LSELPTGTITFLLTDIEGSTRLWESDPEAMRRAIARHDDLAATVIARHAGRLVKSRGEGDSLFAVFARATDAVASACALQQAFAAELWPGEQSLRVRMALHTGEADLREADYYGPVVNRCARLRAVAHGGQVLLSIATAEITRDSLPVGASLLDIGEQRLRDLTSPLHVFQLVHPDLPADFPALRSLDRLPNNLPLQWSSFIGREKEIAAVKQQLESTCLLTLVGPGGCGKTRLALQVAADLLEEFPDGVWLVELALLSDPALIPQAVASALDVREEPGRPLMQTLVDHIKTKHLLLILDNCEHVLTACAQLADALLRVCPHVRLLATSRERLGMSGETTFPVPSLSRPDPKRLPGGNGDLVASLSQYEAVRLFIERAVAVQPAFRVTRDNAQALVQVCHRLDGLPLAIELAAARVRALAVEQIDRHMDDRFRLLTGGSRTALPRQQTLRALIDWSYDLLSELERELFHRIAVFVGGFTLEAAESVCGADAGVGHWVLGVGKEPHGHQEQEGDQGVQHISTAPNAYEILDLLTSLVDKSLLVVEAKEGSVRYHLLETLRQYALEKLEASGRLEALRGCHRAYFLRLAEEAERKLYGVDSDKWLERLEAEHDNLRAALAWRPAEETDPDAGLRLASAIWYFWHVRGYFSEGRKWLAEKLADGAAGNKWRARALHGAGVLARNQGDFATARALAEESLAVKREMGDRQGIAASLNTLAVLALAQGDYAAAQRSYGESLQIERGLGNRQGITASLFGLGNVALEQGDYATARAHYEESLKMKRELGDRRGIAYAQASLGKVALCQADYTAARTLLEESLALRRYLGDKRGTANSLHELGKVAAFCAQFAEADALLTESMAIKRELGDKQGLATSLHSHGLVALERGEHEAARALFAESLHICQELENRRGITYALEAFAALAALQEQAVRAARLYGAAEALREMIGAPLPVNEREEHAHRVERVRAALDAAAFDAAWAEGRTMTITQAAKDAMQEN